MAVSKEDLQAAWESTHAAPELGISISHDVVNETIRVCLDLFSFDISVMSKDDQDSLFLAALDAWTDWPANSESMERAVADRLRSLAVADRWDHLLENRE